ncbi:PREDICTED: uncharacterized protein LOC107163485 [Diuraphis noxia]|uniref:uncharacterized protein LOC107163485 n=1 Tax=Diuraphis noxia TaxID=143948 RepID=UPI00076376C4|nr:PREDICTED: uncharacterized protein LOC107163485 [Diuraphis noxia]
MVNIKSHSLKFVFFLFCLSQVQAGTKLLPEKTDNPFDELFREISKSVTKVTEKIRLRLTESEVHVDKYFDNLKENAENTNEQFQEVLQKVSLIFFIYSLEIRTFTKHLKCS